MKCMPVGSVSGRKRELEDFVAMLYPFMIGPVTLGRCIFRGVSRQANGAAGRRGEKGIGVDLVRGKDIAVFFKRGMILCMKKTLTQGLLPDIY